MDFGSTRLGYSNPVVLATVNRLNFDLSNVMNNMISRATSTFQTPWEPPSFSPVNAGTEGVGHATGLSVGTPADLARAQRAYEGHSGGSSLMELALEGTRDWMPESVQRKAASVIYDPGPAGRFGRSAMDTFVPFVDAVPGVPPNTTSEKVATGAGALVGYGAQASLLTRIPGAFAAPSSQTKTALLGAELGGVQSQLDATLATPPEDRLIRLVEGTTAGAALLTGLDAGLNGVRKGVGRLAYNLVEQRTYALTPTMDAIANTPISSLAKLVADDRGALRTGYVFGEKLTPQPAFEEFPYPLSSTAGPIQDSVAGFTEKGNAFRNRFRDPMARLMWGRAPIESELSRFYIKNSDGTYSFTENNPALYRVVDEWHYSEGELGKRIARDRVVMGGYTMETTPNGVAYSDTWDIGLNPGESWRSPGRYGGSWFEGGKLNVPRAELFVRDVMDTFTTPPTIKGFIPKADLERLLNVSRSAHVGLF